MFNQSIKWLINSIIHFFYLFFVRVNMFFCIHVSRRSQKSLRTGGVDHQGGSWSWGEASNSLVVEKSVLESSPLGVMAGRLAKLVKANGRYIKLVGAPPCSNSGWEQRLSSFMATCFHEFSGFYATGHDSGIDFYSVYTSAFGLRWCFRLRFRTRTPFFWEKNQLFKVLIDSALDKLTGLCSGVYNIETLVRASSQSCPSGWDKSDFIGVVDGCSWYVHKNGPIFGWNSVSGIWSLRSNRSRFGMNDLT